MLDKLQELDRVNEKFVNALKDGGAPDATIALVEIGTAATRALLQNIIEVVGGLDVEVAELRENLKGLDALDEKLKGLDALDGLDPLALGIKFAEIANTVALIEAGMPKRVDGTPAHRPPAEASA